MNFDLQKFLTEKIFLYFDNIEEWREFCEICRTYGISNPCDNMLHGFSKNNGYVYNYKGLSRGVQVSPDLKLALLVIEGFKNEGYSFFHYRQLCDTIKISAKDLFDLISEE